MSPLFKITIAGRPQVKKNSLRRIKRGNKIFTVPSAKYEAWAKHIAGLIYYERAKSSSKVIDFPVKLIGRFFNRNHKHEQDLDNSCQGFFDILQKTSVLQNDRLIHRLELSKHFGFEDDWCELEIWPIDEREGA